MMSLPSNYKECLTFMYAQLPMFQRQGPKAFKKDLTNISALCACMDNPQDRLNFIHIAGTNGKGSVTHILGALHFAAGKKVGIYTSPHFKDYRERIKVGKEYIPEDVVVDFIQKYYDDILDIQPSFFEITVAMAFWYFEREKADLVLLETGLGGRLDSTNIVTPDLSVITNIGFDHMDFLGDTLQKIALEKAGIIKSGTPVVIGKKQRETTLIFREVAQRHNAPIAFAEDVIRLKKISQNAAHVEYKYILGDRTGTFSSDLITHVQKENLTTALAAHWVHSKKDADLWAESLIGLKNVKETLAFKGRWQILSTSPLTIADGAHNKEGLQALFKQVKSVSFEHLHIVFGAVFDKDLNLVFEHLPKEAKYYLCAAHIPRAMDSGALYEEFKKRGYDVLDCKTVEGALKKAHEKASPEDLVLICGSMYVIAEIV